ncbi:C1QL4-like protein [Mya arenaria]|uniref:C1QL4-like protein n=1 Tax=Mya arenaria TaxID=6604 RepID=A0ABY7GDB7_MYAAR|nr:C1QL4-like protein [Mya arenaria]
MYYSKCVQEFFIIVLVFDSSLCGMNEPQCFSRFDYDEKMLEKMVRAEIKDEELLGKLEALEQRLVNVENKVDNTVKEIQGIEKKHDAEKEETTKGLRDIEKAYDSLQTELEKFENTTTSIFDKQDKCLEVYDQRLDARFRNSTANMNHSPVAFFATISSSFTTSSSYQTLVFDKVLTDVGGGYKPGTGVFTAPVNGLYVFSASVMVDLSTSASSAHISINKKSSRVVYLFVNDSDGNYETGVGTVILSLQVGDTIIHIQPDQE